MPDEPLYRYRIRCLTEDAWVLSDYRLESEGPQTTCPHDTAHTIDPSFTSIVDWIPISGKYDSEGNLEIVRQPLGGSEHNAYAPNMTDKCCWYPESVYVQDEALSSTDQLLYKPAVAIPFWIDLKHGRVFKEDRVLADNPTMAVKVEVSAGGTGPWLERPENPWGSTTPGGYTVDYEAGEISFNPGEPLDPSDLVRASFHRSNGYVYYVEPAAGKMLKVIYAEVQYTQDVHFNDNVNFAIEAYINPMDPGAGRVTIAGYAFKRLVNFYEESVGPYPVMPAHGGETIVTEVIGEAALQAKLDEGYLVIGSRFDGSDWRFVVQGIDSNGGRAMQHPLLTVPFHYNAFVPLYSTAGMRIKITLENNVPLGGTFGNITFYTLSEDDPNL